MNIVINGDTVLTVSIGAGKYAHRKIKEAVVNAGFDFTVGILTSTNTNRKIGLLYLILITESEA